MTEAAAPAPRRIAAVTGATGFLGPHVLAALELAGWRLRILTRRHPRDLPALSAPVEVVPGDLGDADALAALCEGAALVVHMAGAIKARDAAAFHRANAEGSDRIAEAWREAAPDAGMIHVSSLAAREPDLSPYAASKAAGEAALRKAAGRDAVRLTILRPAAVYGPGDRETLALFRAARLPRQPLLNGPDARVAMVHVQDVAAAIAAVADAGCPPGVWELSDARRDGYAWAEFTAMAARVQGRPPRPFRLPRGLLHLVAGLGFLHRNTTGSTAMLTAAKLREILHPDWSSSLAAQPPVTLWQPRIGIEEGFAGTVAWYREQGWLD